MPTALTSASFKSRIFADRKYDFSKVVFTYRFPCYISSATKVDARPLHVVASTPAPKGNALPSQ
jgi:hypothetical protein